MYCAATYSYVSRVSKKKKNILMVNLWRGKILLYLRSRHLTTNCPRPFDRSVLKIIRNTNVRQ